MNLSLEEVRLILLTVQGLLQKPSFSITKETVLEMIRTMAALQIDTISVVERSPYFVLWSRLGNYNVSWLNELLAEGKLFEYWSHEACFLPIEDYGLYRHKMIDPISLKWKYSHDWIIKHQEQVDKILETVRQHGEVRSIDFTRKDGKKSGWWEWKPEKRALEMLFSSGHLMIARRHNFHRVYDLRERVLPSWNDDKLLPMEQTNEILVLKAVKALGVTKASWVGDYFRMGKKLAESLTKKLANKGELLAVKVEGWKEEGYFHPNNSELVKKSLSGELKATLTTLLSPFDPLVWDRKRAQVLFGFDYKIECYTPAEKRQYGYFTLPILCRGSLIGRLDAKAHRNKKEFEIKALHFEPDIKITEKIIFELVAALRNCASWHKTPKIVIGKFQKQNTINLLQEALNG